MRFGPRVRTVVLIGHIGSSVGWMGAVAGFIVLDVATVASDDGALLRACYLGMDLLARWAIVPLAFGALSSGVLVALGTAWGLFRHYWVVVSLVLTLLATIVLVVQLPLIAHRAALAADPLVADAQVQAMGNLLLHSIGGMVVLVVILALNVAKPRGLTRYGWRKQGRAA